MRSVQAFGSVFVSFITICLEHIVNLILIYPHTGDKSGAEAPGPSEFPISFNEFTNVSLQNLSSDLEYFHLAAIWRRDIYWKFIMNKISPNFSRFGFPQKVDIFSTRLKIPTKFQFRYVNLYQKTRKDFFSIFNIYFLSRDSARFRFVNMIIIILKNAFIFARTFRINF